jgi:hypothetical protein
MWTRPDSFIYIAGISMGSLMFAVQPRREVVWALFKAAVVCTILYLPWFVFAWWYYGSPIPHTVIAKSPMSWTSHLQSVLGNLPSVYLDNIASVLKPSYASYSSCWPAWIGIPALVLGLFSFFYWLVPSTDGLGRIASFTFAIAIGYFMLQTTTYPWYVPPAGLLAFMAFATGPMVLAAKVPRPFRAARGLAIALCALVAATNVWLLYTVTRQVAVGQRVIENGHRVQIGLWLKEHVRPGETIYLECLGYMGYFSSARINDWPGLVSPRVVQLRKERHHTQATMVMDLKPDWIVARPEELKAMAQVPGLEENYRPVQVFDAEPELAKTKGLIGIECLLYDARFVVVQRITAADGSQLDIEQGSQ